MVSFESPPCKRHVFTGDYGGIDLNQALPSLQHQAIAVNYFKETHDTRTIDTVSEDINMATSN